MTINTYIVGKLVRIHAAFTTAAGAFIDPEIVTLKHKDPLGVETTLTYPTDAALVKDSVGNYHVDIDAEIAGMWYVRWYSTGLGQTAEESQFLVLTSAF